YAAYPAAGYVVSAGSHTLTAQNANGCISAITNITVNAQPATPTAPTVNVVQPTCAVATGTITINSATAGLTFSLDGVAYAAYPASGYVVAAGPHTLRAQNASGCISAVTNITVNAQPAAPSAPVVGIITQPTCTLPTGSVALNGLPASGTWTITRSPGAVATTGSGTSTTISGLAPGTYTFTVAILGCTSSASASVLVNAVPAAPTAPVVGIITQPTCTLPTGSVVLSGLPASGSWTITRSPGAVITTGTGTSTTISGLAAGTYTFTVRNAAGCTSASSANVVVIQPTNCGPVDPNKCYYVRNVNSSLYLDISSSSININAKAVQWSFDAQRLSERWRFTKVETISGVDYYTITNLNSNLVLSGDNGAISGGSLKAIQTAYFGADWQKWSITVSGTALIFTNKFYGLTLSVKSNSKDKGADVVVVNSNRSQTWVVSEGGCPSLVKTIEQPIVVAKSLKVEIEIKAYPNPSHDYFTLIVKGNDLSTPVSVRILDVNGRVLSIHQPGINTSLKVGETRWSSGIYFAEVTQGELRKVVRLIKAD
ncbi:MAG: RICIN domain-containing protein, partial [Bacteroidota bacterium]|nr:RICIN domain-containing protein [Bacteroidota bacterium]